MKKLIILILIASTALTGCKSIQCKIDARKAVKHQVKAAERIERLIARGCDFEIDSILKARTIQKVTNIDTVYQDVYIEVPSDKLIFEQKVRCDSLGNVVLDMERRLKKKPKYIKGEVKVVDNVITVECNLDSAEAVIEHQQAVIVNLESTIETLKRKEVSLQEQPKEGFWEGAKGVLIWLIVLVVLAIIARITYYKLKL